jgi:hypothetical protein
MEQNINELVNTLKQAVLDSPDLAIMILDAKMNVVWHNRRFGEEFAESAPLDGKKCYDITKTGKPHQGCPLRISQEGRYSKGMFDFGEKNFFFMTLPLGDGYAAKIHTYLPKQANGVIHD